MIKCEVIIDNFTLGRFDELKNIIRENKKEKGKLFKGDIFECTKEMAEYLTGNNALNKAVVKVVEVMPEKKIPVGESVQPIEKVIEAKIKEVEKNVKPKTTKKKTSKK